MNTDKFFTPLKIKSGKLFDYLNELVTHDKDLPWERHFGWDALEVDSNWIQKDYALRSVNELHPIKQLGILKTPPDSLYQFHKDQYRLSTINMLISETDAHCFFMEDRHDGYYFDCAELMYEPRTYYLLIIKLFMVYLINPNLDTCSLFTLKMKLNSQTYKSN